MESESTRLLGPSLYVEHRPIWHMKRTYVLYYYCRSGLKHLCVRYARIYVRQKLGAYVRHTYCIGTRELHRRSEVQNMLGGLFIEDTDEIEDDSDQDFYSDSDTEGQNEDTEIAWSLKQNQVCANLNEVVDRLSRPVDVGGESDDSVDHLYLISRYIGNMTQCRIHRSELRRAGAVRALVNLLGYQTTVYHLPSRTYYKVEQRGSRTTEKTMSKQDQYEQEVVAAAAGAIRDLSCGNADVRREVRENGGLPVLLRHLQKYHGVSWECVSQSHYGDLTLLTNICGAMRNVAHSSQENDAELHGLGATEELAWRLLHGSAGEDTDVAHDITATTQLHVPDVTKPWREAFFRSVGTLVNIAEKCNECALFCASNRILTDLMVECWGGMERTGNKVVIHLGLAAILEKADEVLLGGLRDDLRAILVREEKRRRMAQEHEKQKKKALDATKNA